MKFFGKKEAESQVTPESETEVEPKKHNRRKVDDYDVTNAHPGGHPDDVHKNLFRL